MLKGCSLDPAHAAPYLATEEGERDRSMTQHRTQRYWLARPETWRTGPGHKVHLTRDTKKTKGKKALCQVEKNAHGMGTIHWQKEALTLAEIQELAHLRPLEMDKRALVMALDVQKLCKNCLKLAEGREG